MRKGIVVIGIALILIAFYVIGPIGGIMPSFFPWSAYFILDCLLDKSDHFYTLTECLPPGLGIRIISDILPITGLILVIKGVLTSPKGKKSDLPPRNKYMFIIGICLTVLSLETTLLHYIPTILDIILLPTGLILAIIGATNNLSRFRRSAKTEMK